MLLSRLYHVGPAALLLFHRFQKQPELLSLTGIAGSQEIAMWNSHCAPMLCAGQADMTTMLQV